LIIKEAGGDEATPTAPPVPNMHGNIKIIAANI
jgi:hypothetical protein